MNFIKPWLLFLLFVSSVGHSIVYSQETVVEGVPESQAGQEQVAQEPAPIDLRSDPGAQLVIEAQEDTGVKPAEMQSAKESLSEYLKGKPNWNAGWDRFFRKLRGLKVGESGQVYRSRTGFAFGSWRTVESHEQRI